MRLYDEAQRGGKEKEQAKVHPASGHRRVELPCVKIYMCHRGRN